MGLDFIKQYGGHRLVGYEPQPMLLENASEDTLEEDQSNELIDLSYEVNENYWQSFNLQLPTNWTISDWSDRPLRFIDGKNVGEIIAWLKAPGGYPIPVRFSQIGSVVMRLVNGELKRDFAIIERVISMITSLFPWQEVEAFAAALQKHKFRLLSASLPDGKPSYDFERMRSATEWRTTYEMILLEELAIAQGIDVPTIVDGPLSQRVGGFDHLHSPMFGVIKKHHKNYLHSLGLQILYDLEVGQRTPMFSVKNLKLPIISWYVRISGGVNIAPNWGIVRVEVSKEWFENNQPDLSFVDRLSSTIYQYRCREASYSRAPVSLHPIVRAEESLGALLSPTSALTNRFYHLTNL